MNTLSSLLKFIGAFEPVGSVKMYAGSTAPSKWLFCRGQAISRSTYAKLFDVIGTTYGAGDGSTTFNLPDLRDRMPIGVGNLYALNAKGGSKDAIVPYHLHSYSYAKAATDGTAITKAQLPNIKLKVGQNMSSLGVSGTWYLTYDTVQTQGSQPSAKLHNAANGDWAYTEALGSGNAHTHNIGTRSGNTAYAGSSGNTTNANLPPYIAMNYIIFAGK